jgi:riboflavin kinase/FMN adenylyltransferase
MATHTADWDDELDDCLRGGAVTIGNFDGLHRGHASLIAELRTQAQKLPGPAVVVSFDPHPRILLRPTEVVPVLSTLDDRARLLHEFGADHVLILHTTSDLLALDAADFFRQVVQQRLAARAMVEGPNFGFGRKREGNIDTLARLCQSAHIGLTVVPPLMVAGEPVSSSRVRAALAEGDVAAATGLLGRPYRLHGIVGTGQRRGQSLGFPTANLERIPTVVPGDGVYAVRVLLENDSRQWAGAANIGPNPTFGEQARKVEVHLIGFTGDLRDAGLTVDFVARLRATRRFASPADLIEQLRRDVEQARKFVGGPTAN